MGRSPCCEKVGLKKGPWTPEEDQKLLAYIDEHGHGSWRALPAKAGLQRCGKSCRLRWTNYLRPDIKRGKFSLQEEQTIIQLHALLGNRWSAIATHLPKRTDNEIKNYWNTHLKKRLAKMGIDPVTHKPKSDALGSGDGQSKSVANLSHMAQWESARLEAEARLVRESKLRAPFAASSASYQSSPPPPPPPLHDKSPQPCLDVLRAWQGVWSKSTGQEGGGEGGRRVEQEEEDEEEESPTSTLSFTENLMIHPHPMANIGLMGDNSAACHHHGDQEVEWKCFGKPMRMLDAKDRMAGGFFSSMLDTTAFGGEASWQLPESSSIGARSSAGDLGSGLTGMLMDTSGEHNSSENCGGGDSDNAEGGSCIEVEEEQEQEEQNKNYWNNILDLVNSSSSPSHSPPSAPPAPAVF